MATGPARIVATGWGWRYAGRRLPAVSDVSFVIEPGERVLLLGASGSGKSTLLRAIAGVLGGDDDGEHTGSLTIDDAPCSEMRGRVGLVQQDPESNIVLSKVGDDVAFGPENLGVPREQIWPRVAEALDEVGLIVPLDRPTTALSGGQKQRLGLASALAMQPSALLLDEPTANLDPVGVREVRNAVVQAADDTGATLIVIEHRVAVWADVVSRVIVLGAGGGVLADGTPAEVFQAQGAALAALGVWVPGHPPAILPLPVLRSVVAAAGAPKLRKAGSFASVSAASAPDFLSLGTPVLQATKLSTTRDGKTAVSVGLDVELIAGHANVLTGPNGSGKSTLALTLAGLTPELAGEVVASETLRDGIQSRPSQWDSRELLTRIGTVFQEPEHQFLKNTLREELAVGPQALGWSDEKTSAAVDEMLDRLGLLPLAEASPFTLSGGQKRRLSVGTVLIASPEVLVLDEPTFGQDRLGWESLVGLMQDQVRAGRTVLAITHDTEVVAALGGQHIQLQAPPVDETPVAGGSQTSASAVSAPARWQILDRVNPATKLFMAIALTVPLLFSLDWVSSAVVIAFTLLAVPLTGVGYTTIFKRTLPLLFVAPLSALSMLLYAKPFGEIFWQWGLITISQGSIQLALAIFVRVFALALPVIVLFSRVDSTELADALAQVLHLPSRFVLATLAGTRTLGLFVDDWRQMGLARRARGVDDTGKFSRFFSMAFVLLVFAVRRGSNLATAMEARGFGAPIKRTWARESRLGWVDLGALVAALVVAALAIWAAQASGAWHPLIP